MLLELGGNAAVIVADDAARSDALHDALDRIVLGAFAHAGQVCIKVQRLFVPAGRAEAVGAALVERARAMLPASPLEETTVVGPMIDEAAARRVERWVAEAVGAGARPLLPLRRDGSRLTPCILQVEGAGRGLKVVDDEVFGPVLTVHAYERFDDAVAWANGTRFGLQAGLFTDSQAAIERAFRGLDVGALIVGDVPTFRVDSMPYGGVRDSGLGREGVRYALQEMTEPRLLVQRHGASG